MVTKLETVFREEWGRVVATLVSLLGNFDLHFAEAFDDRLGHRARMTSSAPKSYVGLRIHTLPACPPNSWPVARSAVLLQEPVSLRFVSEEQDRPGLDGAAASQRLVTVIPVL